MKRSLSQITNVSIGKNVELMEPSNLYGCILGDDVFVGPFVEIQKNVRVGANTRIQSHSFICEFVEIGKNCFVGHGVMFVNDKFSDGKRAMGNVEKYGKTSVADNVYIGNNATILPVSICGEVVIGAGSVVTKNITKPGKYAGNPARKLIK